MAPATAVQPGSFNFRASLSRLLGSTIVFLALVSTQLTLTIKIGVSLSGSRQVNLSEPLFVLVTTVVAARLIAGDWKKLDESARFLVKATGALVATWFTLTVFRRILTARWVISITLVEILVFAVATYLIFRLGWLGRRAAYYGVFAFFTLANCAGLYLVIIEQMRVRATGLLANINVYVGFVLFLIPIMLRLAETTGRRWVRLLILANCSIAGAMVLLSGSRFAALMGPLVVLVYFLVSSRLRVGLRVARLATLGAGICVVIALMVGLNPAMIEDFNRASPINLPSPTAPASSPAASSSASAAPTSSTGAMPSAASARPTSAAPATAAAQPPAPTSTAAPSTPPSSDPDFEPGGVKLLSHERILRRSLAVLSEHWMWGTGRPVIFFTGWGYHPPHNLFLEAFVFLGIPGSVPYLMVALYIPWMLLRKLGWRLLSNAFALGTAAVFGYSMLQPLMTDYLVLLVLVWGLFGAMSGPGKTNWPRIFES